MTHPTAPPLASAPPPPSLDELLASAARIATLEQAEQDAYRAYWTAPTAADEPRFQAWRATLAALHTARQVDAALRALSARPPRALCLTATPPPRALRATSARGLRALLRWLCARRAHPGPAAPGPPVTLRRLDAHTVAIAAPPPPALRACLRHACAAPGPSYGWWLLVMLPGGRVPTAHGLAPTDRAALAAGLAAWAAYCQTLPPEATP
jgi:hypothetical protein